MHPRIDQDLSDSISEAVAIEDAEQPVHGGLRIAVAREIVGQRDHGQVIGLLNLLGWGQMRHAQAAPRNGSASWTAKGRVAFASMKARKAGVISVLAAARSPSSSATSLVASRDQPSMALKATIRTG